MEWKIIRYRRKNHWNICNWGQTVMKPLLPTLPILPILPTKSLSVNLQTTSSPLQFILNPPNHPLPSLNPSLSIVSGGLVPLVGLGLLSSGLHPNHPLTPQPDSSSQIPSQSLLSSPSSDFLQIFYLHLQIRCGITLMISILVR